MSVYTELQKSFEQREAALTLQLNLLAKAAGGMADTLGAYLGLSTSSWNHPDGKVGERYIRIGEGSAQDFEAKPWMMLSSRNGVVPFSLAVAIVSEDRERRITYVFEMKVQFCQEGYQFWLENTETAFLSADEVKNCRFEPVHQMIVDRLMAILDPTKILITT